MNKEKNIVNMRKEVARIKAKLIRKAMQNGLWENFGQKEERYLSDKYDVFGKQDMANELLRFDEWASTYSPNN